MLTDQDKQDIRQISSEVTTEVLKTVMPPMLDHALEQFAADFIAPPFEGVQKQIDELRDELKDELREGLNSKPSIHHVNTRFDHLEEIIMERTVDASLRRDRRLQDKTHLTVDTLSRKGIISQEESHGIKSIPVFEPHQV